MIPTTIKELFGQIQIDADNQIIFNRELYENEANKIIQSLLKEKREKKDIAIFKLVSNSNDLILEVVNKARTEIFDVDLAYKAFVALNKNLKAISDILNAPEPKKEK